MKILIIEDERHNANRLQAMVKEINPENIVCDILESVTDSVEWFNTNPSPDLILMDVRLSDGLCFEIFTSSNVVAPVIFTTAYDEYAIKAFKVNSIDYLLKPIHRPELEAALTKFKQLISNQQPNPAIADLIDIIKKQGTSYRSRFLIPLNDGYKSVGVEEVDYIYSEFKITHLVSNERQVYATTQTMDELEEQLDPSLFFRANRQHIISLNVIKDIHNYFNGKLKVVINKYPEVEILISREKAVSFKHWLDR